MSSPVACFGRAFNSFERSSRCPPPTELNSSRAIFLPFPLFPFLPPLPLFDVFCDPSLPSVGNSSSLGGGATLASGAWKHNVGNPDRHYATRSYYVYKASTGLHAPRSVHAQPPRPWHPLPMTCSPGHPKSFPRPIAWSFTNKAKQRTAAEQLSNTAPRKCTYVCTTIRCCTAELQYTPAFSVVDSAVQCYRCQYSGVFVSVTAKKTHLPFQG